MIDTICGCDWYSMLLWSIQSINLQIETDESKEPLDKSRTSFDNQPIALKYVLQTLLTSKIFYLYMMASFIAAIGYYIYYSLVPLYAEELGIPKYHVRLSADSIPGILS